MPPRVPAMRYHSRLSMKRRPHPFSDNLGCGTPIGHRIPEASNITIAIVKLMATVPRGRDWARRAKGWFLEFRLIPVLLWSYTAVALGTGVAFGSSGTFNPMWFAVALALGGLIQGWVTHAINEIYDWRSGTDRVNGGRALSGGSRVRNLDLLEERDLWWIFAVSTAGVAALAAWGSLVRAPWLGLLISGGYALGPAYTIPPFATSYRPLAGDGLGGFPAVLLSELGAYTIQTLSLSPVVVLALSAHALVCTAMLMVHHYLDARMDAAAKPPKRTTVVAFGFAWSKRYAAGMASVAALVYGLLGLFVHRAFLLGAALPVPALCIHLGIYLRDIKSVTRGEPQVIPLGVAAGLAPAGGLAPPLWPLLPIAH